MKLSENPTLKKVVTFEAGSPVNKIYSSTGRVIRSFRKLKRRARPKRRSKNLQRRSKNLRGEVIILKLRTKRCLNYIIKPPPPSDPEADKKKIIIPIRPPRKSK